MEKDKEDLLTHMSFPKAHWKRLRTINSVERLNREVKRRFDVAGISGRRYINEESMNKLMEKFEDTESTVVKIS